PNATGSSRNVRSGGGNASNCRASDVVRASSCNRNRLPSVTCKNTGRENTPSTRGRNSTVSVPLAPGSREPLRGRISKSRCSEIRSRTRSSSFLGRPGSTQFSSSTPSGSSKEWSCQLTGNGVGLESSSCTTRALPPRPYVPKSMRNGRMAAQAASVVRDPRSCAARSLTSAAVTSVRRW
ncbi:hypothetical protein Vretimale_9848, partial [Volvox reticuliferus]